MACFNIFNVFDIILHKVCSLQHESLTSLTYPGSCKSCFSRKPVFGEKVLLIFPIIYQIAHLHNWPTCPLIFADSGPGCQNIQLAGKMSNSLSLLIYFTEIRPVWHLQHLWHWNYYWNLYLSDLIMPKPVFLMTVHEAHKEYNSLIDQIRAKYKLLDSGECGSVGTPAFNAECSKLAHLMARMSKLCKHLNLPMPKELHRPPHFKHWSALNSKLFVCGRFS